MSGHSESVAVQALAYMNEVQAIKKIKNTNKKTPQTNQTKNPYQRVFPLCIHAGYYSSFQGSAIGKLTDNLSNLPVKL